ncbi:hypothetical protein MLD38_018827 [Melastoma candidum]|uniref:Uncharacterized protein n=1 Tax=Melastoma candidum TaxID=119954 RepID=A0ACB9QY47_9MYRT|nr:hypothetical protein MLD38_018827 [Melastoma candidum]
MHVQFNSNEIEKDACTFVAVLAPKERYVHGSFLTTTMIESPRFPSNTPISIIVIQSLASLSLVLALFPYSAAVATVKAGPLVDCQDLSDPGTMSTPTLGGVHESLPSDNSLEGVDSLGRFAVDQHNHKENALLEFTRVVKAREQVVAGTLHHLTIEAIDAGQKKLFEATVWIKPWVNFKELQHFRPAQEVPSITPSDLGVRSGGHPPGWQEVPVHDPEVQDAAQHAVKAIQSRSNSLFPYELQEIVDAKAEVAESIAKFNMLLKVKRGDKEEKFKVEVHKNHEGTLQLNQMLPM